MEEQLNRRPDGLTPPLSPFLRWGSSARCGPEGAAGGGELLVALRPGSVLPAGRHRPRPLGRLVRPREPLHPLRRRGRP